MSTNTTIISSAAQIKGDITFSGELHLEGKIIGNVIGDTEKNARLIIGDTGSVEGDVRVPNIIINGIVTGNVYSSKQLEMAAKGIVKGTVHYHSIQMVKGSQVNGSMISDHTEDKKPKNEKPLA